MFCVAAAVPLWADHRSDRQSVLICGGNGHCVSTTCRAHASAAAAVLHQEGGHPKPYASRSPVSDTTAIPNPVTLRGFHLPFSMEPSQYQMAASILPSPSGGARSHLNCPSCAWSLGGSLMARSPCMLRMSRLDWDNFIKAVWGEGGAGL